MEDQSGIKHNINTPIKNETAAQEQARLNILAQELKRDTVGHVTAGAYDIPQTTKLPSPLIVGFEWNTFSKSTDIVIIVCGQQLHMTMETAKEMHAILGKLLKAADDKGTTS